MNLVVEICLGRFPCLWMVYYYLLMSVLLKMKVSSLMGLVEFIGEFVLNPLYVLLCPTN